MKKIAFLIIILISGCSFPELYIGNISEDPEIIYGIEINIKKYVFFIDETTTILLLKILSNGEKNIIEKADIKWNITNSEILSINLNGMLKGLSIGSTEIIGEAFGYESITKITIIEKPDTSKIYISEVFYDATGNDIGKEFIEIYNDNDIDANISDLKIIDGNKSSTFFIFPENSILKSKEYAVIANSYEGFNSKFEFYPDYSSLSFTLNNAGEAILLYDKEDLLLDYVYIEGGTTDFPWSEVWESDFLPEAMEGNSVHRINFSDTRNYNQWGTDIPNPKN
jgi:lamin tail-like protein